MNLPKGNPLFEKIRLTYEDVDILMGNLGQNNFNGYIIVNLGRMRGVFFFVHGTVVSAAEMSNDGLFRLVKNQRLLLKLRNSDIEVSTYIMSSQIVNVLSMVFTFKDIYPTSEARRGEFRKVLTSLEADGISGVIELTVRGEQKILLLDRGKVVTDSFANEYGQVLCGIDKVNDLIELTGNTNVQFRAFGEQSDAMEGIKQHNYELLERERDLKAKQMGGFMKTNDAVKIHEDFVKEWGIKPSATFNLEVETAEGAIFMLKCSGAKNLGATLSIPPPLMKKMNVKDGDVISVKPVLS